MMTKEIQGRLWSAAPQYWSKHFEPYFMPMYRKAMESIRPDPNTLLLDAGCGSGLFSHIAVSKGAQVMGVDAAPGLLQVAKERNPKTNFLEADLESLPFAGNSFDVVTGFNSFQYAGNFTNALAEAKRVLRDGGKLVIGIWDKPENSDATQVLKAIGTLLPPPPPGTPGPFALSQDGVIESVCTSLNLKVLERSIVPCPFLYPSLTDGIKSFLGTGPAAMAMEYASEKQVQQTIALALKPFQLTEDLYHLQNHFILLIAEK